MKIWVVKIGSNGKTFFDEKSFNAWLIGTTESVSNRVVEIYESTHLESKTVKQIKDSVKESNIREVRIQSVVSENPWFSKFENFKVELAKFPNTRPMIERLNMMSGEQKIITKFLKAQKEFLLCDLSDDVRWFEMVIDVVDIKEMVDGSYKKINGWNTKVMVSKKRKDNFLKAQVNLATKSK